MQHRIITLLAVAALLGVPACAGQSPEPAGDPAKEAIEVTEPETSSDTEGQDVTKGSEEEVDASARQTAEAGQASEAEPEADEQKVVGAYEYEDANGQVVTIPAGFSVSEREGEQTVDEGLVVIGPDGNEFVWVPVSPGTLADDMFAASGFFDEDDESYRRMYASVDHYGGFYMGRYEASQAPGDVPASVPADSSDIWVHIPPQDMVNVCAGLYADNDTVTSFLPWGLNWDATLKWLVHSGCKTVEEITTDSSGWGNYANNDFATERGYCATGQWEEARTNNIYDLAGNYWEWTQERTASGNYAARAGGYSIMGGPCNGDAYPVVFRSSLPGNNHHPNITFRVALYLDEAA